MKPKSAEKLQELVEATEHLLASVFRDSDEDTFDLMAKHLRSLLDAESAAVFLIRSSGSQKFLELHGSSNDVWVFRPAKPSENILI